MSRSARARLVYWSTPAIAVLVGIAALIAASISGNVGLGLTLLIAMIVFSVAVVLAGRRSETVRGLLDRRDERMAAIDLRASATAGFAVIVAVIIGAVVELARGHSGEPYAWLTALAGLVYVITVVILRVKG